MRQTLWDEALPPKLFETSQSADVDQAELTAFALSHGINADISAVTTEAGMRVDSPFFGVGLR